MVDQKKLISYVNQTWEQTILPALKNYILIPNKSPAFDADWHEHGYMDQAINLISNWCKEQNLYNATVSIHRAPNRTPLLIVDVKGTGKNTVLLYGHLDKQPEMNGWDKDLNPWQPVQKADRLYGRGSADDGYAVFAAVTAIKALQQQNLLHSRCIILIEACEESGSIDLPYYFEALAKQIGKPELIICLDSGCGNYEQFWDTTSLRGIVNGVLKIAILKEGVHSGSAGGVIPSPFKILRQLLKRLENEETGKILLKELTVKVPADRAKQAKAVAASLGKKSWSEFPFIPNAKPLTTNINELILNRTWRAALTITGIDGVPSLKDAGNVLLPQIAVTLSMRIPPTCNAVKAAQAIKKILETNPPYCAAISFSIKDAAAGWNAPKIVPWLNEALTKASQKYFGKPALHWGEGGSIPFMGMLGKKFPQAQFVITGVLGPQSNAHGPNEFLHIPTAKKLTCCVAEILVKQYAQNN